MPYFVEKVTAQIAQVNLLQTADSKKALIKTPIHVNLCCEFSCFALHQIVEANH
jgi:hypothetical protein